MSENIIINYSRKFSEMKIFQRTFSSATITNYRITRGVRKARILWFDGNGLVFEEDRERGAASVRRVSINLSNPSIK